MYKKSEKLCLIISGCIAPVSQKYLVLTDKDLRLKQYLNSIEYYIKKSPFKNIIFCDNSNYAYNDKYLLYEQAHKMGKKFEWISFQGNNQAVLKYGKGYGEGEIIEYVLKNSMLIKSCNWFAKITGRLLIKNINPIIENINLNSDKIFMNVDIYRKKGMDTRFYVINKYTYQKYYQNLYKTINDNLNPPIALEDVFYLQSHRNNNILHNLPLYPRFVGKSGGNGRDYTKESKNRMFIFDILCKCKLFNKIIPFYRKISYR